MSKAAARQPCFLLGANRPRRNRPDATLVCRPSRARRFSHAARRPAEVLKLQDFSFYQSISNFVVSLPNVSEKDVKGLLFRK